MSVLKTVLRRAYETGSRRLTRSVVWIVLLLSVGSVDAVGRQHRLVETMKAGDRETVLSLLTQQVDVSVAEADGATALHWAVHRDDLEVARLLLQAGADVNAANAYGVTPLSLACVNGNAAMVDALLTAGADPNAARLSGETVLMTAARTGSVDAVRSLVVAGAEVNATEMSRGQTALMWAVAEHHLDVVRVLLGHGAHVGATSTAGFTPLLFASREGSLAAAELLVAAGADVNHAAADGLTALLIATVRGHWEQAILLLESGADPDVDGTGYRPLHWAAGSWETQWNGVHGVAESYAKGLSGLVPQAKLALVRALLAHGADPNARIVKQPPRFGFSLFRLDLVGATPFFLAALAGDASVMRVLADAGADPLLATSSGTTPVMAAAGIGWIESESLVTEADALEAVVLAARLGGDVNASDGRRDTALHGAAAKGADSIVQFLADRGAEIDVANDRGDTPLIIAEGKGARLAAGQGLAVHESTAKLLRQLADDPSR